MLVPGWARNKEEIMLAVLATLTFLIVIWLCVAAAAATLEQSGFKITAALKGRSLMAAASIPPIKLRVRQRYPSARHVVGAQAELRAAA